MQRRTIIIRGNVQRVGLRIKVSDIAKELGVCGLVENLGDGSVLIVCEAEPHMLDEMMQRIKEIPKPVAIEDTMVETSAATGMNSFRMQTHDVNEELVATLRVGTERLEKVIEILSDISKTQNDISKTQVSMDQKLGNIEKTQVSMDQKLGNIEKTQNDISKTQVSMDQKLGNIEKTQNDISDTQLEMRDTLKSIDGKMGTSLNNDAKILDILREMRAGGMLRIPK